VKRNDRATKIK